MIPANCSDIPTPQIQCQIQCQIFTFGEEDWCDVIIHPSRDVQTDPQPLVWLDRPWLKIKGELRSVMFEFSRTHFVIPLFIEFPGFKGSQKLKKSDEKKVLYIYSANGDPLWFQETQVIPIIKPGE